MDVPTFYVETSVWGSLAPRQPRDRKLSWNHRHMTRPRKRLQYEAVNQLNGYPKTPLICNAVEACDELRSR